MYDEPIILLKQADSETNDNGDIVPTYTEREVFVKIGSITMSETYKAFASDIDARYVFELSDYLDYENEKLFRYNNENFWLVRTYRVPGTDKIEIVVKSDGSTQQC